MTRSLRPIGHEDRLSLVDHLDELRTRLIISGAAVIVAFCFCFWQNHELLRLINKPLTNQTQKQVAKGQSTNGQAVLAQKAVVKVAEDTSHALRVLGDGAGGATPTTRAQLTALAQKLHEDVADVPRDPVGDRPVTLAVGEAFTTTLTVVFYCSLVLALPVVLYELFAFILPALKPNERRATRPLLTAVPVLFIIGVLFGYFVVLPAAVRFFVNFNSGEFNNLVQAGQYYSFASVILLAMGLVFQVPVLILGATRLELVTPRQLRRSRRYAVVACAAIAAFLPGDVITLLLETVPLYLLYEVSILLAALMVRRKSKRAPVAATGEGSPGAAPAPTSEPEGDLIVQQIIDHTDSGLS